MRLRRLAVLLAATVAAVTAAVPAAAALLIAIDKSTQQMTVSVDGDRLYRWPVSTGRAGNDTPAGAYTPFRMERDHFSREWDDAPMPHSIFFTQFGHAIHGTLERRNLGRPASHGCVRLSRANAATLWGLVKKQGKANTTVLLTGEIPGGGVAVAARDAEPASKNDRRASNDGEPAANDAQPASNEGDNHVTDTPPPPLMRGPDPELMQAALFDLATLMHSPVRKANYKTVLFSKYPADVVNAVMP